MAEKSSLIRRGEASTSRYGAIKEHDVYKEYKHRVQPSTHFTKRDCIIVSVVLCIALVAITLSLVFGLPALEAKRARYFNLTTEPSPSLLYSFQKSVVATDAEYCAPIGTKILKDGGSAVDAAIATLFCNGAVNPHSMGIGGGVIFTIYDKTSKNMKVIDGRETAPSSAHPDMFKDSSAEDGASSIAVPGELRAYQEAHALYGKKAFKELLAPTIELCTKGFKVSKQLALKLQRGKAKLMASKSMKEAFVNPATSKVFVEGETMTCPKLAETLQVIANSNRGVEEFYSGSIATKIIEDLHEAGSNITTEDLKGYLHKTEDPLSVKLSGAGVTIISPRPPGSGAVLSLILSVLDTYGYSASDGLDASSATTMYHRISEAFKYAYAAKTHLADTAFLKNNTLLNIMISPEYAQQIRNLINDNATYDAPHYDPAEELPEDQGTAQVSVLTSDGFAVTATSSINYNFGSFVRSPQTGIIFNNHMRDFSTSPSSPNSIQPGKRPLSAMTPAIVIDQTGNVVMVLGGAGGTRITSGQALVAFRHLYLKKDIKQAIDEPRLHHQLFPNTLFYQNDFPGVLKDKLASLGHHVQLEKADSSFVAIARYPDGSLSANVDARKGGSVDGQ